MGLWDFINIIMAVFSLHDMRRICFWHGFFGPHGPHGRWPATRMAILRHWGVLVIGAVMLLAVMSPSTGVLGSSRYRSAPGTSPALTEACAAQLNALLATHRRLWYMTLTGALLLVVCAALFLHWHDLLQEPGSVTDPAVLDVVVTRSMIMGALSTVGKNLLLPVVPWLLLSEAMFTRRCVNPSVGKVDIILSSVISCLWVAVTLSTEGAANTWGTGF